ncbi:DEAD/DEAH box helicase [Hymenobacter sp. DH14]|uniref:DEAD/DEAH box helicase n=1 Tax=Hymenobacter cyanobacteriorum TaxID=2926463 RepID=A0A9X1VGK2_9BACT|nr:DEAD/DEAH box helicase [Hymenobacter cyanobacteriorum]MCI1187787.1 DEAD/DEAH box helicase [Hymenobacter cyanobacteriorum]
MESTTKNNSPVSAYQAAYEHSLLNSVTDNLILNTFINTRIASGAAVVQNQKIAVHIQDIRKCVWLASILANSAHEDHRRKAQTFAALVYLNYKDDIDIARAAYVVMSRAGNLIATKFLAILFDANDIATNFKLDFGSSLNYELESERESSTIEISKNYFLTTRFQRNLWEKLNARQNIAISAPTSSGKSFIIKKYIEKRFNELEKAVILYIVPSRALINQVSEELRRDLNISEVDIRTAFITDDQLRNVAPKQVFVLTAERCLKLLQYSWLKQFVLDLIFVDEIQNAEDEGGRGTILEYVLRELLLLNEKAQIISAGPNIGNAGLAFYGIFGKEGVEIKTSISPVFQIKTIVKPGNNDLQVIIKAGDGVDYTIKINTDSDIKKKFEKNIGTGLPDVIRYLGGDNQNLIYSPRTDYAEDWALKFAETKNPLVDINSELSELIDFLREEIHEDYFLIDCLQKGIAFHHSKLPDVARKEIEDLFLSGKISNLFCTSTLMEGVNMPANNLFVVIPKKRTNDLSGFEFGNLIGRAGRISDSLYGAIYCIERKEAEWAESYYSKTYEKDIVTVSEKSLFPSQEFIDKLSLPFSSLDNDGDKNTIIFLRHKLIRDEKEFNEYLRMKNVNQASISSMMALIQVDVEGIIVPAEILRLNPSIDPILQNKLYLAIQEEGVGAWVVILNPNFKKSISKESVPDFKRDELSFYWQLVFIIDKLNELFGLRLEALFKQGIPMSTNQMCLYGVKWLDGKSLKELIEEDIRFHARHINPSRRIDINNIDQVNERIKQVVNISSTIVSFILVKYLKLLNDHLDFIMTDKEKDLYKFSLALPIMLELGSADALVIQLISKGITRSVALKIARVFPISLKEQGVDIVLWLKSQTTIGLKPIFERYLRKMNMLKA